MGADWSVPIHDSEDLWGKTIKLLVVDHDVNRLQKQRCNRARMVMKVWRQLVSNPHASTKGEASPVSSSEEEGWKHLRAADNSPSSSPTFIPGCDLNPVVTPPARLDDVVPGCVDKHDGIPARHADLTPGCEPPTVLMCFVVPMRYLLEASPVMKAMLTNCDTLEAITGQVEMMKGATVQDVDDFLEWVCRATCAKRAKLSMTNRSGQSGLVFQDMSYVRTARLPPVFAIHPEPNLG